MGSVASLEDTEALALVGTSSGAGFLGRTMDDVLLVAAASMAVVVELGKKEDAMMMILVVVVNVANVVVGAARTVRCRGGTRAEVQ